MNKSNNNQFFAPIGGKEAQQADQEPRKQSTDYSIWLKGMPITCSNFQWNGLRIC